MQLFKLKCDDFLEFDEATGTYSMPAEQQVRDEAEKTHWKEVGFTLLKDWRLYLMLVPMLLVYLLWRYMPMTELLTAFKDSNTFGAGQDSSLYDWYGLTNFEEIFFGSQASAFWAAFRNTFIIAFYGLLFGFPFPIILALFFNEVRSNLTRSILQVCVYLPKFMSTVIITTLAIVLFKGPTTDSEMGILSKLMLTLFPSSELEQAVNTQGGLVFTNNYFRALFQITGIWEHGGYDSIVFFAAVIAVSPTSYEAAQIDGAGKMQQMRYVVIPSILSTVVIMLIMKIGSLLNVSYEKIFLFSTTGGSEAAPMGNYETAYVVSVWANAQANSVYAMAGEMTNNLLGMILVIGANIVSRKATDVSLY